MKRDLKQMAEQNWDVIVIGGGISGAAIARDAAMRGLRVALFEKGDFSSGTSSATSKLAHGGLRYLKTGDFSLVRESLRERRYLEIIAPHGVYPLAFLLPIYHNKLLVTAGMLLYELFSFDKNRVSDPMKKMPSFKMLSAKQALKAEPGLNPDGLKGAAIYYDCQNIYPDRVALEFIRDALFHGASAANYAKVTELVIDRASQTAQGVRVSDLMAPASSFTVFGKLVINASGPWTDITLKDSQIALARGIRRSKGIHLITRPLTARHALVLETKASGHVFFVLPWRGFSIVGTTDTDYGGEPDQVSVTEKDRDDLIRELNDAYPHAQLKKEEVLTSYVGIRPLIEELGKASTQVSRKHEIYDHEEQEGRLKGVMTVLGGKWTTSRALAEEVVDRILKKLTLPFVKCRTIAPVGVAHFGVYSDYLREELALWDQAVREKKVGKGSDTLPVSPALVQTLIETYGTRYRELLERYGASLEARTHGDNDCFSVGHQAYFTGQTVDAIENEMALTLDDVLRRRTGIGTLGDPGRERVRAICRRMADKLGWDAKRQTEEIDRFYRSFAILPHSC